MGLKAGKIASSLRDREVAKTAPPSGPAVIVSAIVGGTQHLRSGTRTSVLQCVEVLDRSFQDYLQLGRQILVGLLNDRFAALNRGC